MKKEQRKKYRELRKKVKNKTFKDFEIYNNVIKNIDLRIFDMVLIYVSTSEEVDTIKLIKYFLKYKKVAVPKVENNIINFYYINGFNDLKNGYFNIMEPITSKKVIDFSKSLCIVPGICFSKDGYRIGYGGGFYDRFLSNHKVYSIGLCYKECFVEKIDVDEYDKKVDIVITD